MGKLAMINSVIVEERKDTDRNADRNTNTNADRNTDRNTLAMINMSDRSARGQEGLSVRIINY